MNATQVSIIGGRVRMLGNHEAYIIITPSRQVVRLGRAEWTWLKEMIDGGLLIWIDTLY
jgi:hypothetical protein